MAQSILTLLCIQKKYISKQAPYANNICTVDSVTCHDTANNNKKTYCKTPLMLNKLRKKKEYLLQKEEDYKNREIENKKSKIMTHLSDTTRIRHDLRADAKMIAENIIYNQTVTNKIVPFPKIMVTTSKKPSSKLLQYSKHIALIFNGCFVMRGGMTKEELSNDLHAGHFTTLVLVHEKKGTPCSMTVSEFPYGNTWKFSIHNMTIQKTVNLSQTCHFVANEVSDNIKQLFSKMLPANKNSKRILMLANTNDTIAFRHFLIEKGKRVEIKPDLSFDMKLYEIRKGTFEQEGEIEWVYKPFINSHKSNVYNKVVE